MPDTETLRAAALSYAAAGICVFPVLAGRKEPATANGVKDATTDPAKIASYWSQYPYNVGIRTGPESGLFVVDVDPRNGGEWESPVPTATARTGGGGSHYYFRWPAGVAKMRRTLKPGVDVQGRDKYVIAVPSVVNGNSYEWTAQVQPADAPLDVLAEIAIPDGTVTDTRPGDRFNAERTWQEVLEPYGWKVDHEDGAGVTYWTRPGKDEGISATTNYHDSDLLYVFSTSTDFEADRGYDKFGAYCVVPDTLTLTADLRSVRVGDLVVGDELFAVDESGVDTAEKPRRKLRVATVEAVRRLILPCYVVTFEDGRTVTATGDHGWLTKSAGTSHNTRWLTTTRLVPGQRVCAVPHHAEQANTFDDGWLSGMFDGEGWASGAVVGLAQKPGPIMDRVERLMRERGFHVVRSATPKGVDRLVVQRQSDQMRLLMTLRPERLVGKRSWAGKALSSDLAPDATVVSVTPVGEMEVAAVQTSTRTLITEGLVSHNSVLEYGGDIEAAAAALAGPALKMTGGVAPGSPVVSTLPVLAAAASGPAGAQAGYAYPTPSDHLLTQYIHYAGMLTDAAPEYHEAAGLVLLAVLTSGVRIALSPYPEGLSTNLYVALVGPSSLSRKSTAQAIARTFLRLTRPNALLPDRASGEMLIQELAQRRVALWMPDELGVQVAEIYQRGGYLQAIEQVLLTLYGSRDYRYQTLGRGETAIVDLDFSILGAATPESFAGTGRALVSGLLPRFGVVYPRTLPPPRPPTLITPEQQQWREGLTSRMRQVLDFCTYPGNSRAVTMTSDALAVLGSLDQEYGHAPLTARLVTAAYKITALVALADLRLGATVEDANAAVAITRRWAAGAHNLRRFLGRLPADVQHMEQVGLAKGELRSMNATVGTDGRRVVSMRDFARQMSMPASSLKKLVETMESTGDVLVVVEDGEEFIHAV